MLDPTVYTVIVGVLACALLTALILPAPAHASTALHLALLGAGCLATLLMGLLALLDRFAEGAICGAIAWLLVMPCVWLARAPLAGDEWGYEDDDDDDGGSPWPRWPSAPPARDDRLAGLQPSRLPAASLAWASPAPISVAATSATALGVVGAFGARQPVGARQPDDVQQPGTAELEATGPQPAPDDDPTLAQAGVDAAAGTAHRRSVAHARRTRGECREIMRPRAVHPHAGRRRRASLSQRLLRSLRRWLWCETPQCTTHVPLSPSVHERRPGAPRPALRQPDAGPGGWGHPDQEPASISEMS